MWGRPTPPKSPPRSPGLQMDPHTAEVYTSGPCSVPPASGAKSPKSAGPPAESLCQTVNSLHVMITAGTLGTCAPPSFHAPPGPPVSGRTLTFPTLLGTGWRPRNSLPNLVGDGKVKRDLRGGVHLLLLPEDHTYVWALGLWGRERERRDGCHVPHGAASPRGPQPAPPEQNWAGPWCASVWGVPRAPRSPLSPTSRPRLQSPGHKRQADPLAAAEAALRRQQHLCRRMGKRQGSVPPPPPILAESEAPPALGTAPLHGTPQHTVPSTPESMRVTATRLALWSPLVEAGSGRRQDLSPCKERLEEAALVQVPSLGATCGGPSSPRAQDGQVGDGELADKARYLWGLPIPVAAGPDSSAAPG